MHASPGAPASCRQGPWMFDFFSPQRRGRTRISFAAIRHKRRKDFLLSILCFFAAISPAQLPFNPLQTCVRSKLQPLASLLDDDYISVRDGLVSLCLAYQLSPGLRGNLTEDEINAIVFHDGAYAGRTGLQDKETVLQIIIHAADLIAARFLC